MKKLNKTQKNILKDYEEHLSHAQHDFMRGVYPEDVKKLKPIYEAVSDQKLNSDSCGVCVLNMLKYLANLYFSK